MGRCQRTQSWAPEGYRGLPLRGSLWPGGIGTRVPRRVCAEPSLPPGRHSRPRTQPVGHACSQLPDLDLLGPPYRQVLAWPFGPRGQPGFALVLCPSLGLAPSLHLGSVLALGVTVLQVQGTPWIPCLRPRMWRCPPPPAPMPDLTQGPVWAWPFVLVAGGAGLVPWRPLPWTVPCTQECGFSPRGSVARTHSLLCVSGPVHWALCSRPHVF